MDERAIERELREHKARLEAELEQLTRPPEAGQNLSFGKRVGDGTTEAVERIATTATARSIEASLKDVERALAKIEDASYGLCDRCGKPIPAERLEAKPAAVLCVGCSAER